MFAFPSNLHVHKVTDTELRRRFNAMKFEERVAKHEVVTVVLADRHPSSPLANEPICTKSQLIGYFERNSVKLAEAHRYLRPDGSIGLSGMADPKKVVDGQDLYMV